jgi:hypothetical protein
MALFLRRCAEDRRSAGACALRPSPFARPRRRRDPRGRTGRRGDSSGDMGKVLPLPSKLERPTRWAYSPGDAPGASTAEFLLGNPSTLGWPIAVQCRSRATQGSPWHTHTGRRALFHRLDGARRDPGVPRSARAFDSCGGRVRLRQHTDPQRHDAGIVDDGGDPRSPRRQPSSHTNDLRSLPRGSRSHGRSRGLLHDSTWSRHGG